MNNPTNKTLTLFGLIWAIIFAILAYKIKDYRNIFFILFLIFISAAIFFPRIFYQLKIFQNWVKFGDFVGRINGIIICILLFFGIFTPAAFYLRIAKKDFLGKKIDKNSNSYFIDRSLQPQDMTQQF